MKKKLSIFFVFAFIGCATLDISNSPSNKTLAYASGKALAITINRLTPPCTLEKSCIDKDLSTAWVLLMERNEGVQEISSLEMISFYNECLRIIASPVKDPYGLIGDLSALLLIYSAEFDNQNGELVAIRPVPVAIMQFFEMGYTSGRKVAQREN